MDNVSGSPMVMTRNWLLPNASNLTYDGSNTLEIVGTGSLLGAFGVVVNASTLSFNGNVTGAYLITKTGAGTLYVKQTANGIALNAGGLSCNSCTSLTFANTSTAIKFTAIDHPTN